MIDYDAWLMSGPGGPEDSSPTRTCAICKDEIHEGGPDICPLCEQELIDREIKQLDIEEAA